MTEPAASIQDIIVRPDRPRSRKRESKETLSLAKRLTPFLTSFMFAALGPVIKDLRARLAAVENRHRELERAMEVTMQYRGVWEKHRTYVRGITITHAGSLWLAEDTTDSKPGTDGSWKLIVKNGSFNDQRRTPDRG